MTIAMLILNFLKYGIMLKEIHLDVPELTANL